MKATLLDIPLAVGVADLAAVFSCDSVIVSWETQSELNNLGFNIFRKEVSTNPSDSNELVASYLGRSTLCGLGTSTNGKRYSFVDHHIVSDNLYEYTVESVSSNKSFLVSWYVPASSL